MCAGFAKIHGEDGQIGIHHGQQFLCSAIGNGAGKLRMVGAGGSRRNMGARPRRVCKFAWIDSAACRQTWSPEGEKDHIAGVIRGKAVDPDETYCAVPPQAAAVPNNSLKDVRSR